MKKWMVVIFAFVFAFCGHRNKDGIIKADLTTKSMYELDFVGIRFTVHDGVVTFNGNCATERAREKVLKTARQLYGVRTVISNIKVAPVVIGTDLQLKQEVDSILKSYAGVEAITQDSIVVLKGELKADERTILINKVSLLKPKKIEIQLRTF